MPEGSNPLTKKRISELYKEFDKDELILIIESMIEHIDEIQKEEADHKIIKNKSN